jgi:hypothetical protein
MKVIYNLTDLKAEPRIIQIGTQSVGPGRCISIPDDFPIRKISYLVESQDISVGSLPEWYQSGLRQRRDVIMEASRRK